MMKAVLLYLLILVLSSGGYAQTTPVCPNNLIVNGDLAISNPTNVHQDIDNATGFSRIWATGSFAEIYPSNYAPVGTAPSPASGVYASFWVANNNSNGSSASYREGFKVELTQTVLPNTGTYTLTFDMACLHGFGVAELGVYGIHNPSNSYSVQPTGFNIPDNLNLFGPANTVLLGTVLQTTCSAIKTQQTIVINTNDPNYPTGGMTHIMFTHSGNPQSGGHYTGFDDFCLVANATPNNCSNYLANIDLEQSTPTTSDNDIDNATGFSRIWATGSLAEIYPFNYAPTGTAPSPASGVYASFWVANNNSNGSSASYREGFKVELTQTILPNTGSYTLTFDMACLNGFGVAELGVYGIHNPSNSYSVQPTGFNIPDNLNLFGPANTVLLGTVLQTTCSAIKTQQTIVINSNDPNYPTGGMTHIMFTHSGNPQSGGHYTGFDNFCLVANTTTPSGCAAYMTNTGLEQGSPSTLDNDIDNAVNYSRIWATGNSAGYYPASYSPYGFFAYPSPATGNYAGCWIVNDNTPSTTTTQREGFKVELTSPILANSGTYDLSFDVACLKSSGTSEVGIYGVYNPSNAFSAQPTGHNTPSNLNLFGLGNTVLLGTVVINSAFTSKVTYTINFNSNAANFPTNGMTHFFITKSDNQAISGTNYVTFDDFCLTPSSVVPPAPCPEVKLVDLKCIPDINGDGVPDYQVDLVVFNSGSIYFTTGCGLIAPASITGPGNHSITIASNGTCFPFQFEYYILNSNQEQCFKEAVEIKLPRCGKTIGQANLFPNPVTDYVQVRWSTEDIPNKLSVRVFNANGVEVQSVLAVNGHEGQLDLDTKDLGAGLYFIKIEGENYQMSPIKFIKINP